MINAKCVEGLCRAADIEFADIAHELCWFASPIQVKAALNGKLRNLEGLVGTVEERLPAVLARLEAQIQPKRQFACIDEEWAAAAPQI